MEIVEFGHMTAGQRDELQGDEDDPFGGAGITLEFQRKQQHVALSDDRGFPTFDDGAAWLPSDDPYRPAQSAAQAGDAEVHPS